MYVYMCVYHRSEMVSQSGIEKFVCVLNSVQQYGTALQSIIYANFQVQGI